MMVSREVWGLRDGTPSNKPNKEKPFQARKNLSKQGKIFPNKEKHLQTRKNLSKQGKHQQTRETPFNKQEKYFSGKETPFKQVLSSDQM